MHISNIPLRTPGASSHSEDAFIFPDAGIKVVIAAIVEVSHPSHAFSRIHDALLHPGHLLLDRLQ